MTILNKFIIKHQPSGSIFPETIADTKKNTKIKFLDSIHGSSYVDSGFEMANRHGFEVVPIEVEVRTS